MPGEQDVYDRVAYPGYAYPNTHPDRLAAMGLLHGLDPAPVESCRVLEIGCNEGANLVPMAYAIPGGEFVGFDLAGLPIARGQRRIAELGLTNIRLFQADLMQGDLLSGEPEFDYIIAHGVYAWVGEAVRDRLLALCRERLAPNGIAFVSYAALPGGHVRNLVREILLDGVAGTGQAHGDPAHGDPVQDVSRGLELLRFIVESRDEGDPLRALLEQEEKQLTRKGAQVVYHDELSREYRPVSFSSFMGHAGRHGLQYLSEAVLPPPNDPCFQPRTAEAAKALGEGDPIAEEQALDFVRMRMYRETLLCHAGRAVSGALQIEASDRLLLASQAESSSDGDLRVFSLPEGVEIKSRDRATAALMELLIEAWPRPVGFAELGEALEAKGLVLDAEFLMVVLRLAVTRMVELHAWAAPVSGRIASRPRASAVSRQEAEVQARTTTLLHRSLSLDDALVRRFLLLLDGTRDRAELLQALRAEFPETPEATLAEGIEPALRVLGRAGVLLEDDGEV